MQRTEDTVPSCQDLRDAIARTVNTLNLGMKPTADEVSELLRLANAKTQEEKQLEMIGTEAARIIELQDQGKDPDEDRLWEMLL